MKGFTTKSFNALAKSLSEALTLKLPKGQVITQRDVKTIASPILFDGKDMHIVSADLKAEPKTAEGMLHQNEMDNDHIEGKFENLLEKVRLQGSYEKSAKSLATKVSEFNSYCDPDSKFDFVRELLNNILSDLKNVGEGKCKKFNIELDGFESSDAIHRNGTENYETSLLLNLPSCHLKFKGIEFTYNEYEGFYCTALGTMYINNEDCEDFLREQLSDDDANIVYESFETFQDFITDVLREMNGSGNIKNEKLPIRPETMQMLLEDMA